MRPRQLLAGLLALVLSASAAYPFGLGELGAGFARLGSVGVAGASVAPAINALGFLPAGSSNGIPNVSAGSHAALQWERTQPWSLNAQIKLPGPPSVVAPGGGTAAIIFTTCNQGSGTIFTGYEVWVDGNSKLRVRLINNVGTSIFLGTVSTTSVADGNWHNIGVSYDGSGAAAGVKNYIDGVLDTLTVESDTLGANTIVNTQPFVVGNQLGFPFPLGGYLKSFQLSNIVRSQAYSAAYTTPAVDANVVLAYNFSEGSGTTTADLSASGFTGTLNGAQWPPTGSLNAIITDNAQSANAASTYTFGSRNFAVRSGGLVLAAAHSRIGANTTAVLSSLTIGGSAATFITGSDSRNTSAGALSTTSWWLISVPSGNTETLSALYSATMARAGTELFSVVGSNGSTPTGSAVGSMTGTSIGAVGTCTVTVPVGGVALIAGSLSSVTGTPGVTPTNYTPHGGPVNLASTMWYASGSDNTPGTNTYTMTWTGTSPSLPTMSCVAFGP